MIIYTPVKYYQIGMLRLGTEPVAMTLAFAIFIFLVIKGLEKQKLKMDVKEYFVFFSIVLFSALAGGRIWFYIAHWEGLKTIIDIFNLSKGGLYSIGCIIGGAIGLVVYALVRFKKEKKVWQIEFARIADIIAAPAALAFFIYRLFGCTLRGDIKGAPTDLPWCFMWPDGICRHPASGYMALSALLIFIILKVFFGKEKTEKNKFGKRFDGEVILWFLLLYCFANFWIDFLVVGRSVPVTKHLGMSVGQWAGLVISIFSSIALIHSHHLINKSKKDFKTL